MAVDQSVGSQKALAPEQKVEGIVYVTMPVGSVKTRLP